jgi:NNP family nitrate/nitrite transporter-like MFS transporter
LGLASEFRNMIADASGARGHWPSLLAGFVYYAASLWIWVLPGSMARVLSGAFELTTGETALMVALPILTGVGLRPLAGMLADRFGPARIALGGTMLSAIPLLLGWLWANSFVQLLVVGALLGVAGASFGVALSLAGRWYSGDHQGLVLGLVGAGNCGAALAALAVPRLVGAVGWHGVFALGLIPVGLALAAVAGLAKDPPLLSPPKRLDVTLQTLGQADIYWFCLFYALTFGGLIGSMGFLTVFLRDQYQFDPLQATTIAAFYALAGSLARPLGGLLADRFQGTSVLFLIYVGLGVLGLRMSYLPHLEVTLVSLFLMLLLMGMGNGVVFQMIPGRFPDELGAVTGMVGAAGGLGGILLPVLMGYSHEWVGHFGPAFFTIGLGGLLAAGLLLQVSRQWESDGVPGSLGSPHRREVEAITQI